MRIDAEVADGVASLRQKQHAPFLDLIAKRVGLRYW